MNNINDSYFDGCYKDIWRSLIPAELTVKEADFMLEYFKLKAGSKVLDMMCGYGRHAIALARKGMHVTAVDNLEDYIVEVQKRASEEGLAIKAVKSDIINYKPDDSYDLAICMGNSLNFFNAEEISRILSSVYSHLGPRGSLLINTWSLAEIAIRSFVPTASTETNGIKHICESGYLFHPTRIESDSTFLFPNGHTENKRAVDYIFSVAEMEALLNKAGFNLREIYSIPGKKKFALGEPRAYLVADKN